MIGYRYLETNIKILYSYFQNNCPDKYFGSRLKPTINYFLILVFTTIIRGVNIIKNNGLASYFSMVAEIIKKSYSLLQQTCRLTSAGKIFANCYRIGSQNYQCSPT